MKVNYKILVEGSQRKKPRGRPRHRKKDNIKMNLQKIERKNASLVSRGFRYGHNKTKRGA